MVLPSSISTRIQYQHKSMIDLIDGLSEEQIRRNIQPGKWSIFENIVHLQTYQHSFCERIKKILQEDDPAFDRYLADSDPLFADNCQLSLREVMQDYIMMRKEIIAASIGLTEKDIQRKGSHPVFGSMNISQWLNFFLLHEAHHLFTIFRLAAALRSGK
jgi:uncharacterized damage-inducible protein DinB